MQKIYYNGSIVTMAYRNKEEEIKNNAEAVMIEGDKITAVGNRQQLIAQAKADVQMIDLQGHCLMPAFIDSHSHFVMSGQTALWANLGNCNSHQDIIDTLKLYVEENKVGQDGIVIGFGYDQNFLKEKTHPDKCVLDKVSAEMPVMIFHVSLHMACVNSTILKLAKITEQTENPVGGVIGRRASSMEPNGYLEEAAVGIVQNSLAPYMRVNPDIMIEKMQMAYLKNGITTVQDGMTGKNDMQMLQYMTIGDKLMLDVVTYPAVSAEGKEIMQNHKDIVGKYKNHVKIGGYKLILDGSPQGRSAWMSEPYVGGEEGYCGYPWLSDEAVEQAVREAVNEKQQLLVHCNGDAASEQFLNAYEKIVKESTVEEDLRPVMIHCQTVRNDQMDRMAKLGMIASIFVGHVWYWGDVHVKNFGEIRGNHISPVRDALDRGIHVNFHQDTPVTAPNMLHSVWCAVNRVSRSGNVIGEDQKIDVYNALRAVTIEGAYEYREEETKGSIECGKQADLIILDKSPLEVTEMELKNIIVLETIKDGKVIYKKEGNRGL